jgi:hypothetical protein
MASIKAGDLGRGDIILLDDGLPKEVMKASSEMATVPIDGELRSAWITEIKFIDGSKILTEPSDEFLVSPPATLQTL